MPFVADGRTLIREAFGARRMLPAFNVCSAEMVRACLEAAEALGAPVIVQTYPSDLEQLPPNPWPRSSKRLLRTPRCP